jgi:phosphoribosylanthranilate isomerase
VIDTLPSFAGVSLDELEVNKLEGTKFLTPSIEAYLKIYIASSKDSYRANNNNHKDLEKIEYLRKQLRT